jgi:threonine/homoserine/homoserine lactone efflux protein
MSASLPLPLAIFCASLIWFLTAYTPTSVPLLHFPFHDIRSYLGAEVLQWIALHGVDAEGRVGLHNSESTGQEELLAAALLLDDLNETGLQLLN